MRLVNERLEAHLRELKGMSIEALLAARYSKFRSIAQFYTTA
jgi:acetyl-CoA carboxylase carboxyl transferase subunit alpha